jgi:proteic killer suppression protein
MIASFGDQATEDLYHGRRTQRVRHFPAQAIPAALRKLDVLRAAQRLQDLRSPPGNRLEALKGDYAGWYSIRVNQQWRIVFRWEKDTAYDVSLIDYHG